MLDAATTRAAEAPRVGPGRDVGRPIRAALLSNPVGGFNKRGDHIDQARRAAAAFEFPHVEVSDPGDIFRTVRQLDADGVELLIVNGGDGTVQMALTALFAEDRTDAPPLLVLLPGGTSNTIPGDVGWKQRPPAGIHALLTAARRGRLEGHIAPRPVLRVESPLWERPMCAMQFSAGAIYNAINFYKREIESRGAHGQTGPAVTVAWFIVTILSGRSADIFPEMRLDGTIDGRPVRGGPHLGVVASTLDHLFLGIRPFWGDEPGRLRFTALGYSPRRLLLAMVPALRGRRGRFVTPENGYTSYNGDVLDLEIDAGFTLDGELFDVGAGTHVRITAPAAASFLRMGRG